MATCFKKVELWPWKKANIILSTPLPRLCRWILLTCYWYILWCLSGVRGVSLHFATEFRFYNVLISGWRVGCDWSAGCWLMRHDEDTGLFYLHQHWMLGIDCTLNSLFYAITHTYPKVYGDLAIFERLLITAARRSLSAVLVKGYFDSVAQDGCNSSAWQKILSCKNRILRSW